MPSPFRELPPEPPTPLFLLERPLALETGPGPEFHAPEWLETNGLGDYASLTAAACPTRRYHGLLVARPRGSAKRHVWCARFDEVAVTASGSVALGIARYGAVLAAAPPLVRFELRPWPCSVYALPGGGFLTREVLMVRGAAATLVRYSALGLAEPLTLELRPLVPCREADALTIENSALDPLATLAPGGFLVRPYTALPALGFGLGRASWAFEAASVWYRGLTYSADLERGFPGSEDQWSPGIVRVELDTRHPVHVAIALADVLGDPRTLWEQETARRLGDLGPPPYGLLQRCELAADDFLARTPEHRLGVTAGFPWFGEWGRDTFISLPGLTLARGRFDVCEDVLLGALAYLRDGLLPNIYGVGPDDSHYGSADAALWFARAVFQFDRPTRGAPRRGAERRRTLARLRPALEAIATAYLGADTASRSPARVELGLRVDEHGLLFAGTPELNPTGMDARVAGVPVTPRDGAPVELNALWYELLAHLEELALEVGDASAARRWKRERARSARAFLDAFWLSEDAYLADVWKDGRADPSVRPNMVIAAALELSPLARTQRQGVCQRARAELLTPRGLRTLSPADPRYVGRYAGGPNERDAAYHQGTVWPWLLGFFVEAELRLLGKRPRPGDVRELAALWLAFAPELDCAGLGHVSEVFDGDLPQAPGGTIAQAWNTAELLRSMELLRAAGAGSLLRVGGA